MAKIIVKIDKQGNPVVQGQGFVGETCKTAMAPYLQALGLVESEEPHVEELATESIPEFETH